MAKQYHYLVASLPNLVFEHEAKNFDLLQLKDFVIENISAADSKKVDFLFSPIDIQNILNCKINKCQVFIEGGRYTEDELKKELENPQTLPQKVIEYLQKYDATERESNEGNDYSEDSYVCNPEIMLYELFYEMAESDSNKFIRQWFTFDREMRNIQAAFVARKLGDIKTEDYIVGKDDITEQLLKSGASDFGLRRERDYIEKLWQALETDDILEREKKLDLLRWGFIDEITAFNYFDLDVILAFLQKASIINRWMKLDAETGAALFEQLVSELKQSYNAEEVFGGIK